MENLYGAQLCTLFVFVLVANFTFGMDISTESQLKLIFDKLDTLEAQLHEVQQKNKDIELENVLLKKENGFLHEHILKLDTETSNIKMILQQILVKSAPESEVSDTRSYHSRETVRGRLENGSRIQKREDRYGFEGDNLDEDTQFNKRLLVPDATPTSSSKTVAFTAVLTHIVNIGPLQTLQFDKVLTNIGDAYEPRDGHFSAPVNGVYLISATTYVDVQGGHTEIVKDGVQLVAMYCKDHDQTAQTIAVVLNQGDRVWVRHFLDNNILQIWSNPDRYFATFSGALIAPL